MSDIIRSCTNCSQRTVCEVILPNYVNSNDFCCSRWKEIKEKKIIKTYYCYDNGECLEWRSEQVNNTRRIPKLDIKIKDSDGEV